MLLAGLVAWLVLPNTLSNYSRVLITLPVGLVAAVIVARLTLAVSPIVAHLRVASTSEVAIRQSDDDQWGDDRPVSAWIALIWGTGVIAASTWLSNWWQEEDTLRRDVYANKEECVKDWGDERNCEPEPGFRSGTGGHFYGPAYRSGQYGSPSSTKPDGTVDAARPGSHAVGTAHVARGGFGGSGAAHGASGS